MSIQEIDNALRPLAQQEGTATAVYAALCNVAWVSRDHPAQNYAEAVGDDVFLCTWRWAGGYVADLRGRGESYMDFYCSGGEGTVSEEVRQAMAAIGYRPVTS